MPALQGALGIDGLTPMSGGDGGPVPATSEPNAVTRYPHRLESTARLRDGTIVQLRPIRPEDGPLLHDLVAHMSRQDLRLRFFTPIRDLTPAMIARLTRLDYDRDMALAALQERTLLGIARYFAEPDRHAAEYAIAVRTDWKGRGVGYLLMTRLIEIAREAGIGVLSGEVLHENTPMLAMCSAFGFTLATDPDDPALVRVRKELR